MQGDGDLMSRVSSFPHEGVDHLASPLPPPPMSNLRSTPFDWGSSPATVPTEGPTAIFSSTPGYMSAPISTQNMYAEQRQLHVPEAGASSNASGSGMNCSNRHD